MEKKQTLVAFNEDQYKEHESLKMDRLTSQDFAAFVKSAYHEKVDKIRTRHNTFNVVSKETKQAVAAHDK